MPPFTAGRRQHPPALPFHLLEVTIISAQDLPRPAASRPTYAVAWVNPSDKLATTATACASTDPAWNDKLVFRVDDAFLRSETSAVTIHLLAARGRLGFMRPDPLLGTVRVVVSSVHPSASTRFVALQVRRPTSLRPHGLLNLGIALIPTRTLYFGLGAPLAFAYRDLIARPSISHDLALYAATAQGTAMAGVEMRRSGSVAAGSRDGDRERELLESKLRKWRTDLSPIHDPMEEEASQHSKDEVGRYAMIGTRGARRRRRVFCCFSGGGEELEEGSGAMEGVRG